MKFLGFTALLLLVLVANEVAAGKKACTSSGVPCKFPFKYNGKTYDDCIANFGGSWCGIKSEVSKSIHGEDWGYCHNNCTQPVTTECTTDGYKCIWPYTDENNHTHTACIYYKAFSSYNWCPIVSNYTGRRSEWGKCGSCPENPKIMTTTTTTAKPTTTTEPTTTTTTEPTTTTTTEPTTTTTTEPTTTTTTEPTTTTTTEPTTTTTTEPTTTTTTEPTTTATTEPTTTESTTAKLAPITQPTTSTSTTTSTLATTKIPVQTVTNTNANTVTSSKPSNRIEKTSVKSPTTVTKDEMKVSRSQPTQSQDEISVVNDDKSSHKQPGGRNVKKIMTTTEKDVTTNATINTGPSPVVLIVVGILCVVVLILTLVGCIFWKRRVRKAGSNANQVKDAEKENALPMVEKKPTEKDTKDPSAPLMEDKSGDSSPSKDSTRVQYTSDSGFVSRGEFPAS